MKTEGYLKLTLRGNAFVNQAFLNSGRLRNFIVIKAL